jgi:hypothetical protein
MRKLLQLAALLAVSIASGACAGSKNELADPASSFHAISAYGSAQHVSGHLAGTRADPITGMQAPAGVPYTERVYDLGGQFDLFPAEEKSVLGAGLGLLIGANFGYVSRISIGGDMPVPEEYLPIRMGVSAGTGIALVRRPGLMLALHTMIKMGLEPERLGDTAEAPVVLSAGGRAYVDTGPLRTRVTYDFIPFWGGESRLEHRLTGLFSTRPDDGFAYGVRAALAVGQKRLDEGGLNDVSLTIGLEVQ